MGLQDETLEVLYLAQLRMNLTEIADVIAGIVPRRGEDGGKPHSLRPQPLDIFQLAD
jgi:hypothetical protein